MVRTLSSFHCALDESYTEAELVKLRDRNCYKVFGAIEDFEAANTSVGADVSAGWVQRAMVGGFLCDKSKYEEDKYTAAWLAVNAWGVGIMEGAECCALPHAPYCLAERASLSSLAVGALLAVLALLFLGTAASGALAACCRKSARAERRPLEGQEPVPFAGAVRPLASTAEGLYDELRHQWLTSHCLRALPEARSFAQAAAGTFAALQSAFDFQQDSVRNQYEHLLSLWRSHCATVADRSVQEGIPVDEAALLVEALGDLHAELLEGFDLWRTSFYECKATGGLEEARQDEPLPVALRGLQHSVPEQAARQLAEVAAYLLVWGEAGNVRFMPEVLYFLTELVLCSESRTPEELYGAAAAQLAGRDMAGAPFSSNLFLARVVRPIYNVIFNAWYDCIDVGPHDGRNVKKLHKGFETYLPPDVANYDDWNELFCNPERLVQGLFMDDGTSLFEKPHGQRFAALHRVDWAGSLDPHEVKTHREVHSLWGVFATTHRIWLLHAVMFSVGLCLIVPAPLEQDNTLLQGSTLLVRFAAIGLLVPVHSVLWAFARWQITSHKALRWGCSLRNCLCGTFWTLLWALPLATYAAVRYLDLVAKPIFGVPVTLEQVLYVHFAVSATGLLTHLLVPGSQSDKMWELTSVPKRHRLLRYLFWAVLLCVKMLVSVVILGAVSEETLTLDFVKLGREPISEITQIWYSNTWGLDVLRWLLIWSMSFFLFVADTGVWYQVGCTVLGVTYILAKRQKFALERAISKIPERFSQKVFTYSSSGGAGLEHERADGFSSYFPAMWDRIVEHMHQEDKCKDEFLKEQSFGLRTPNTAFSTGALSEASTPSQLMIHTVEEGMSMMTEGSIVKMPELFNRESILSLGANGSLVPKVADNAEMQWRLNSLARCLGMKMPKPFRAPYIPGITVLIPHFQEDILTAKEDLYSGTEQTVPLIAWVKARFPDEFDAFKARMQNNPDWVDPPESGCQWAAYSDKQWEMISLWASMRLQTLWRTVAGMCMYQSVLQCHYDAQADESSALAAGDIWDPSDCFTCLVSMQQYNGFSDRQIEHTNRMLSTFPASLKVAFIDWCDKNITAEVDGVHQRQRRRYFSCLIDRDSQMLPDGRRASKLCIELPGFPILGDGKSDNQNHAIPFMRGALCQCIDSNQGAYLEQMLLLPCVLGEFRTQHRGESQAKRIIGLPEHITSDFGSVGDFAAGSELAFGTVLQRSHALLGARMHYGHPDIMNKQYMMQQGGVSKATKTLNLSEDIFAGMDFRLRGAGRKIRHCEYFYLTKGRDLGFNAVMGFFSKLSSGTGEQILTRQMFRLGQILSLPEALSFYYAHAGYYVTQAFISLSMPVVVTTWLMVLAGDCEPSFKSFMNCPEATAGQAMAQMLSAWCSWVLVFFLVAQALPLFVQVWMEMGLKSAIVRTAKQWLTCSWCFFIFQAKLVGFYTLYEIRYGGATYVNTGRGLPTQRSPFIGVMSEDGKRLEKVGGLYLDYAMLTYYDGMKLLLSALVAVFLGGIAGGFTWTFLALTVVSWLYAPFLFNPYQFSRRHFGEDLRSWWAFFFKNGSSQWVTWYNTTQLKPRRGFRHSVWDIKAFLSYFCLAVWFAIVDFKLRRFQTIFGPRPHELPVQVLALCPPIALPLIYCLLAACLEGCIACARSMSCNRKSANESKSARQLGGGVCGAAAGGEDAEEAAEEEVAEEEDGAGKAQAIGRCRGVALPVSAVAVVLLGVAEAAMPLYAVYEQGWYRAVTAGLLLKLLIFRLVLFLAEGVLRCRYFDSLGVLTRPLEIFVYANRLARDLFVSFFIFWTLAFGVLLNTLNDALCPSCNLHQLLIYRARPLSPDPA